MLKSFTGVG
jgi:hypothetical protein